MHLTKRLGSAITIALLPGVLLALGASAARAQLVVTLTPDTLTTTPGSTLTFLATIQNQSTTDTYFFNDFSATTSDPSVTVDSASFFGYVPASLAPGATYGSPTGGNFVDVLVDASAPVNTLITGTFTVYGGINSSAHNTLATPKFNINVVTVVVPETSTSLLLGLGGIAGIALGIRRRRKSTVIASSRL